MRGRNGGLRLAKQTSSLTIGEVVQAMESDFALVACLPDARGEQCSCVITPQCRLRNALEAGRDAFFAELDKHTIGEVAQPRALLIALLGLGKVIPIVPAVPVVPVSASGGSAVPLV